jgi:hypothetical protein
LWLAGSLISFPLFLLLYALPPSLLQNQLVGTALLILILLLQNYVLRFLVLIVPLLHVKQMGLSLMARPNMEQTSWLSV